MQARPGGRFGLPGLFFRGRQRLHVTLQVHSFRQQRPEENGVQHRRGHDERHISCRGDPGLAERDQHRNR